MYIVRTLYNPPSNLYKPFIKERRKPPPNSSNENKTVEHGKVETLYSKLDTTLSKYKKRKRDIYSLVSMF